MVVSKRWFTIICVVGFFVLAAGIINVQNKQSSHQQAQKETRITDANRNCRRASARTALAAAYIIAEGKERPPKDPGLNDGYAQALIDTVPVATTAHTKLVAAVERITTPDGGISFKLTPQALALQKAGCDKVFP